VPDPGNRRPEYPPAELAAGVEGTVVLKILLSETGEVLSAEPLAGDEPFVTAALIAAREWRYAPVRVEGRPRSVYFVVRIPFRAKKR
jgi:TonB family protein